MVLNRSDQPGALQARRRDLLESLDSVSESRDKPPVVLDWQLGLLDELVWCETARNSSNSADLKLHKELVRYIGDGLMWRLLTPIAFRVLSREYSKPPGLAGQWSSIDHVVNVARALADEGVVPLITDVAHALQAGDVVARSEDLILIIECKNREAPVDGRIGDGRLMRQIDRMRETASYLSGNLEGAPRNEDGGPWIALPPGEERSFSFETLTLSLRETREQGESLQVVEDGDIFLTTRTGHPSEELLRRATRSLRGNHAGPILIGGPHRLVTEPSHDQAPLSSWPMSVEDEPTS